MRILRINSSKTTTLRKIFQISKKSLIERGYPQTLIENLQSDIKFTERESALLKHNKKEEKEILPFVTLYQPSVSTLKEVLMKKWNLIQNQPLLRQIFKQPPVISYKKEKSLKDTLVRAKIKRLIEGFKVWMCGLPPLKFSHALAVNKSPVVFIFIKHARRTFKRK